MTWRLMFAVLCLALLVSCSPYTAPYVDYDADCGHCSVDEVERLVQEVAGSWDLHFIEEGRERRKRWTGEDSLDIFLSYDERTVGKDLEVVWVTHLKGKLGLMFFDENDMSIDDLECFIEDLKGTLASRIGVEFCRTNGYGICDEESALLEEQRQASLHRCDEANSQGPG